MEQSSKLREKILKAPDSSGVYLMRDSLGRVLYVGKANSLKKRMLNYLSGDLGSKTLALMVKVASVEFRLTTNQNLALLLESKLIHEFKPRYNISLKDDKSFPLVRITGEVFPSISITRKAKDQSAQYLGPYTSTKLLNNTLKIIRHSFTYRSCRHMPKKSCIYYRINLCPAPCIGKINSKEYKRIIDNIILILGGNADLLIQKLTKLMQDKSKAMDFEAAARIRDQVAVLSEIPIGSGSINRKAELEDLKKRLGLNNIPTIIEGFDISNISGKQAVGSMVSFKNGIADKNNYRRFRIKGVRGINDYEMIAEVVARRYGRLIREKKGLPDLLLIDGGRGQLIAAAKELKKLNLKVPLVSIAKPHKGRGRPRTNPYGILRGRPRTNPYGILRGRDKENIYSSCKSKSSNVPKDSLAMNLIRRIRDEAHRFALGYHHILRGKELIGV